jgi:signal transduction histidine kinase
MPNDHADDVEAVARIDIVPTILSTICRATGMGFAAVARVTDERWIACVVRDEIAFGLLPGGELELETTICHEIRQTGMPVIISDVATDCLYASHHTPARYGFRSYISIPIILPDGRFFGTLCAIDPQPRDLSPPETHEMFEMFARIIGVQLDQADRLAASERRLLQSESEGELREQFIAVVGHDLRNPLANVQAGLTLLHKGQTEARAASIIANMQTSVDRMTQMIANILDFARGRLGGGLSLQKRPVAVGPLIAQIVSEIRNSFPLRDIRASCACTATLDCDPTRIAQLISNLLSNAVTHGSADEPITLRCGIEEGLFVLFVSNGGEAIPDAARARMFHPFARGQITHDKEGLGLGLYIASEIAAAHQGRLDMESSDAETRFTLRMPLA